VSFVARGHRQQVSHDDGPRLPGLEAPARIYDIDDRETTAEDFGVLDARFGFSIDVAASDENHKLPRYFTAQDDGLAHPWAAERVWCNPPFSNLAPWIKKAWEETGAPLIVMLIPANRCEQSFWQEMIEPFRDRGGVLSTEFLPGRMRFLTPGSGGVRPNSRPPFGCVLLIWRHHAGRVVWRTETDFLLPPAREGETE
jgi:phage N-6-adenine-methyltransferase